jgi:hypothetical protein
MMLGGSLRRAFGAGGGLVGAGDGFGDDTGDKSGDDDCDNDKSMSTFNI